MQYLNAVGNLVATNLCVPSQRNAGMPDTDKLAERRSAASVFMIRTRRKEGKAMLAATTDSNRVSGSHHAGLLLHTAPMLLIIFLAMCLAVADVLYFPVSPDAASAALGRSLTSRSASSSNPPEHAHESKWRR